MLPRWLTPAERQTMTFDLLLVLPSIALDLVLAIAIFFGRTHGGLTFCRIGRLGFSFYIARKQ
jgi:hypothetical protein